MSLILNVSPDLGAALALLVVDVLGDGGDILNPENDEGGILLLLILG